MFKVELTYRGIDIKMHKSYGGYAWRVNLSPNVQVGNAGCSYDAAIQQAKYYIDKEYEVDHAQGV